MSSKLFKSAIGGYNKTEVDEYALHISRKLELQKKEYEKKLEALEVENRKLAGEKKAIEDKLTEDEAIIAAFRARLSEEAGKKKEPAPENDSEILQKSKRYDEISRLLGEIIANANADAAAIKREASEDAERIIGDAEQKSLDIRTSAAADIRALASELTEKLTAITANAETVLVGTETDAE